MILAMVGKVAAFCFLLVIGSARAGWGQEASAVVDRDIRVFVMSAALNVAGFDIELAPRYHPVRQLLRDSLAEIDEGLAGRLREFYDDQRGDDSHEAQLARYISLALNVADPPGMQPFVEDEDLMPPDARAVAGVLPLVRELYAGAGLARLWAVLGRTYDTALDKLVEPIRDTLVRTEAYLRVPSGMSSGRRVVILLELSLPLNSVNVRNYPDSLYVVLGDSTTVPTGSVRHGYFHALLDSQMAVYRESDLMRVSGLLGRIEDVEGVRPDLAGDFENMAVESLIRAAEIRMDFRGSVDAARQEIDSAYREGMILVPFFDEQLASFESSGLGIREYFADMMAALDVEVERARLSETFFAIDPSETVAVRGEVPVSEPAPDPARQVLEEAQQALDTGDNATARALLSRVLSDLDPENAAALYGMGLIASREQDIEGAREYFDRTIASGTAEPYVLVWSHVNLGRIADLVCDRESALGHYRSALEIGGDAEAALDLARQGLAMPFGSGC